MGHKDVTWILYRRDRDCHKDISFFNDDLHLSFQSIAIPFVECWGRACIPAHSRDYEVGSQNEGGLRNNRRTTGGEGSTRQREKDVDLCFPVEL